MHIDFLVALTSYWGRRSGSREEKHVVVLLYKGSFAYLMFSHIGAVVDTQPLLLLPF
jgi:hypothetical protein